MEVTVQTALIFTIIDHTVKATPFHRGIRCNQWDSRMFPQAGKILVLKQTVEDQAYNSRFVIKNSLTAQNRVSGYFTSSQSSLFPGTDYQTDEKILPSPSGEILRKMVRIPQSLRSTFTEAIRSSTNKVRT